MQPKQIRKSRKKCDVTVQDGLAGFRCLIIVTSCNCYEAPRRHTCAAGPGFVDCRSPPPGKFSPGQVGRRRRRFDGGRSHVPRRTLRRLRILTMSSPGGRAAR